MTAPRTLRPIVHREAYVRAVEREVVAFFAEAVFAPLQIILRAHGVPVSRAWEAIKFDEFGRENSSDWVDFPPAWGSLGLSRREMPQIPAEARGALVGFLKARGVGSDGGEVPPEQLRPTQSGYHADKVDAAREHRGDDRAVLASSDGYILDGHHQWTAARLDRPGAPIRVIFFSAGIRELLRLARLLPSSFRVNAAGSALEAALAEGRVQYADGVFSGKFSSAITRELRGMGASFDEGSGTFRLAESRIPLSLRGALADAASASALVGAEVLAALAEIERNVGAAGSAGLSLDRALTAIENDLGRQFMETTHAMGPRDVALAPTVDAPTRTALNEELTRNLDLSVTGFSREQVAALRARVEENAFKYGGRTDRLAKIIEAEFGVAKRKAEFLADQETGLLVSKYRSAKYRQLGITDYVWSTSGDNRVRKSHRRLAGKRFSFAVGANVAEPGKPARYCNPGEDWRCRCVPRPVVNLERVLADEIAA